MPVHQSRSLELKVQVRRGRCGSLPYFIHKQQWMGTAILAELVGCDQTFLAAGAAVLICFLQHRFKDIYILQ